MWGKELQGENAFRGVSPLILVGLGAGRREQGKESCEFEKNTITSCVLLNTWTEIKICWFNLPLTIVPEDFDVGL